MENPRTERQHSEIVFYNRRRDYEADRWAEEDLKLRAEEIDHWSDKWGFAYRLLGNGGWQGKTVLDIGCGSGAHACYFAMKRAKVSAIDIHPDAIALTLRRALVNSVADKIEARVAPAETLPYPDRYFDLVFCGLVLHHVDMEKAGREIARVLRPGGRVVCLETSARNPLLMFARRFLAGRFGISRFASPMESPLSPVEISRMARHFSSWNFRRGYDFFSMASRVFPPNKRLKHGLIRLDELSFRVLPLIEKWGYHIVLEFKK